MVGITSLQEGITMRDVTMLTDLVRILVSDIIPKCCQKNSMGQLQWKPFSHNMKVVQITMAGMRETE
jgi:hypothetical protein